MVPEAPAQVIARSLSFHDNTTTALPPKREEPGNTTLRPRAGKTAPELAILCRSAAANSPSRGSKYSAFGTECTALTYAVALTLRGCRCPYPAG